MRKQSATAIQPEALAPWTAGLRGRERPQMVTGAAMAGNFSISVKSHTMRMERSFVLALNRPWTSHHRECVERFVRRTFMGIWSPAIADCAILAAIIRFAGRRPRRKWFDADGWCFETTADTRSQRTDGA